jgi:hypothetical protein
MVVRDRDIKQALRTLRSTGTFCMSSLTRCVHLYINGGAGTVIRAFLDEGCTVLVPTFSSAFEVPPPSHLQFERNDWNYSTTPTTRHGSNIVCGPEVLDIDRDMGAIPAMIIAPQTPSCRNIPGLQKNYLLTGSQANNRLTVVKLHANLST